MSRVADLIDKAKAATGCENFGDDGFREGLEILVKAVDSEADLNAQGRASFDDQTVNLLSTRLQIEDWYARHPEIDDEQIVAPLVVLGLPRTGSTALHCLLGEDPEVRVLRTWEAAIPCPPPVAETYQTDPRIAMMDAAMAQRDEIMPRMKQMLPMTATSPTEDQFLMGHDFKSQVFHAALHIPSYSHWLHYEADLVPTFRYIKRVLKLLQWRCPPKRWRLKNPSYSLFIEAFDEVFPDARYCMTHRDVAEVIPSFADLFLELSKPNTDRPNKLWMGEIGIANAEIGINRMMAFRDAGHDHRFFDIHFAPFQKDPFPTLEALHAFIGEPFTAEARARMLAWRQNTPRDKHGRHEYSPADYGLDKAALRERFRFYSDRYNVPLGSD